jgi:hypothetical protein
MGGPDKPGHDELRFACNGSRSSLRETGMTLEGKLSARDNSVAYFTQSHFPEPPYAQEP